MKMKLILLVFGILFLVGIAGNFWGTQIAEAATNLWGSCPRGEVNCQYPGKCRSYIDTNGDRICDLSQAQPASSSSSGLTGSTASSSNSAASTTSVVSGHNSSGLLVNTETVQTASPVISTTLSTASPTGDTFTLQEASLKRSYYFVPIFIGLAVFYGLTWILGSRKKIKTMTHRKIWNLVLLISMLVSALLGIFLILNIDFNFNITLPLNMLFWHVEAGIALSIIGIFHILWHWRYFAKLLNPAEKKPAVQPERVISVKLYPEGKI